MPAGDAHQANDGFYFDLASPECYLVAEQILQALPGPLEWRPVLARELGGDAAGELDAARTSAPGEDARRQVQQRADELGLQPLRWPPRGVVDSERAMLAATYARSIGRAVPFAQAAFRQAFAGGHDLGQVEVVLIAAAACEIHPRALLRALESRMVQMQLASATEAAARAGVWQVPTVVRDGRAFSGPGLIEDAREALAAPSVGIGAP